MNLMERQKQSWVQTQLVAVSLACADAGAKLLGQSLYRYLGGIGAYITYSFNEYLKWWVHADNALDIQEFMIVPRG